MEPANSAAVQHVTKKSSDELLNKFAELGSDSKKDSRVAKRRRMSTAPMREGDSFESSAIGALVERRSLLPSMRTRRRSTWLRQLGIGRSKLTSKDLRNKFLLGTIEKTWRRTVEGASKVFLETHHHRHRRLINDVV